MDDGDVTKESWQNDRDFCLRLIALSGIAVAIVVLGLKYLAYKITGSVALYSDALESIVNVIVSVAAFVAILISLRPADKNHQFGHHKAELFSAVLEGALIIIAAFLIFSEAYRAFLQPRDLDQPIMGMLVNGVATLINACWAYFIIRIGRAWRSPALYADGRHIQTDVITSVGVLFGITVATVTGWHILDPLLACAVAVNILWEGYRLVRGSLSSLMDEAAPAEIQERIRNAIRACGEGALQAHDIRTRHAGPVIFIEFHLVVPGQMTVDAAHDICDRIEEAVEKDIEGAQVLIHIEPDQKAKGMESGVVPL